MSVSVNPGFLRTGICCHSPPAGRWEPCEPRGSRTVLREPGAEMPPATHLREQASVINKYELIDAEKAHYPIRRMCGWIEVSRSGFYDWQTVRLRPSAAARRRSRLGRLVEAAFTASRGTYGARRIVVV